MEAVSPRLGGLSKGNGIGLVETSTISPGSRDKTASWTLSWSTISLNVLGKEKNTVHSASFDHLPPPLS